MFAQAQLAPQSPRNRDNEATHASHAEHTAHNDTITKPELCNNNQAQHYGNRYTTNNCTTMWLRHRQSQGGTLIPSPSGPRPLARPTASATRKGPSRLTTTTNDNKDTTTEPNKGPRRRRRQDCPQSLQGLAKTMVDGATAHEGFVCQRGMAQQVNCNRSCKVLTDKFAPQVGP